MKEKAKKYKRNKNKKQKESKKKVLTKGEREAIIYLVFSFEGVKPKDISSDDTFVGNTRTHTEHDG